MIWKDRNYGGLDPSEVNDVWKRLIEQIELGHKRVLIRKGTGEGTPQFKRAAETYIREAVCHLG
jgi:hypothetical protein